MVPKTIEKINVEHFQDGQDLEKASTRTHFLTPHPLLVDHIIENIFSHLSIDNISSLLKFRLVCSHWNYYATKILQKKFHLSFGGHKYNVGRLKLFLDEFEQADMEDFPIKRFRLFSDLFQECNKSTVLKFMEKCGPTLESLVSFQDINSDIEYSEEDLSQFKCPNLKHFTYSDRRRSGDTLSSENRHPPSFLYAIVSSAKSTLTSLSVKFPREPAYEIYAKEEFILKVFKECELSRLKVLKLDMSISDRILKALENVNLRVECLHLSLGASQFKASNLKAFLHSLRYTLIELRLTDLYRRASVVIDLPKLENLQKFEIHGLELPAYFVTFPSFSYTTKIPNLRKLWLNTWAPIKSWEDSFVPEVAKPEDLVKFCDSVRQVNELSLAMNFDCPILMRRISSMFLGVRRLEMHFSRGTVPALQIVFQHMGQLEELKLNQSYLGEISTTCVDDVLTGLDGEKCKWILRKKTHKIWDLNEMERLPNLTDLKNLKKLDLLGLRHRNIITDVTGYLVFMRMKSLCVLDVSKSEFSDVCLRDLAMRFPNGKFQKYLNKKMKGFETGMYKNSVFTSICALQ